MTTIHMQSQREEKAVLRIFEPGGKLVLTRKVGLVKGDNEFVVRKSEIRGTGIYMYEIESPIE